MQRVAFMGLGVMGTGMAARLLKAGFPLVVYNRNPERAAPLIKVGAEVASSPREASSGAEVVISMVADDTASRTVWLGESGALAGAQPGSVLIESSTLTSNWIRALAAKASERLCAFLDAPVTGTKPHAEAGELLFLVGGKGEDLDKARDVLKAMSRDILHVGPVGSGVSLKLINNFLCGVQAASFAEALALIDEVGLDRGKALRVLLNGAPSSPLIKAMASRLANPGSPVNFALQWMAKDQGYALAEAEAHGMSLKTGAAARELLQTGIERGFGREDFSALYEALHGK